MGMRVFVIRRIFTILICWFVIITILFTLFRMIPGDPSVTLVDPAASKEERDHALRVYGLDKPLYTQYYLYLINFRVWK